MGKKMKFPFLFKTSDTTTTTSSSAAAAWPWPAACATTPKTLSFRSNNNVFRTINSAFIDDKISSSDSYFSLSNDDDRFSPPPSPIPDSPPSTDEAAVVLGLKSDRLFFQPGETSSILEQARCDLPIYKSDVAIMAMDSRDPFLDFRVSMEEMVAANDLKDWPCLEELLTCYLRVNRRSNHGYIVGAFVDMLVRLALSGDRGCSTSTSAVDIEQCSSSSTATQCSFTSPLSFSSSTYSSTTISTYSCSQGGV